VAGVIHSRLVLSPSGSGFSPHNGISYRGVKLCRFSAAFRRFELRRKAIWRGWTTGPQLRLASKRVAWW
jgi:hypothetical protein